MQDLYIETADQQRIVATFFPCEEARGTVIIASALGVPKKYYQRYAKFLVENGFQCICFDYRGTGQSGFNGEIKSLQLIDWGKQDLHAVLAHGKILAEQHSSQPDSIILIGHSIGGQVLGMSEHASSLKAAIFVASSAPYWKRWPMPTKFMMALNAFLLLPIMSIGRDMFPAKKVGLSSMDIPASAAKQWASWMRDPDYLFGKRFSHDISNYKQLKFPLLSLGFDDDSYAPMINIDWLLKFYSSADIENRLIKSKDYGPLAHMGFFKDKFKDTLWKESLDWINSKL